MGYNIELFAIKDSKWKPHVIKVIYDRPGAWNQLEGLPDWLHEAAYEWLSSYGEEYGKKVIVFRSRYILPTLLAHFGTGEPHLAVSLNKRDSKSLAKVLQKMLKKKVTNKGETITGELKESVDKMIKSLLSGKTHFLYIG
jgi:hypothetical protein